MQRVFIGIPVDQASQQQISELLVPFKKFNQHVRWVPKQNLHLTLAFLGNQPVGVIENLMRSMNKAYRQETTFQTGISTLRRFPKPTGNIIALGFEAETQLFHLFQITQKILAENGFDSGCERFKPHITLGRIRKASLVKTKFNRPTNIRLHVDKIALYQSTLTHAGSIYLALKEIELDQPSDKFA